MKMTARQCILSTVFGQDSNPTTWKMAQMNLAIRGIEADLGKFNADTFFNDCHPQHGESAV